MSARIRYTDEAIGDPRVVDDFLPPPHMLALKEDGVKVADKETSKSNAPFVRKRKTTSGV